MAQVPHSNLPATLRSKAVSELVFASLLWGFGFVATSWALRELGPITLAGVRMGLAFGLGMVICLLVPSLRRQLAWNQFRLAFWPGLFLCATLVLQTWGLRYTTVTKCGFITTLYVLIVPVMERVLLGRRIPKFHMFYVAVSLGGIAMICDLPAIFKTTANATDPRSAWNIGDWITLGCAFAASLQIVWFGKIQNEIRSSFIFNIFQTFWSAILPLGLMLFIEIPPIPLNGFPLLGLLELVVGSTMIAFALQVRAQKSLSPSMSSLIFLLESPFAALFGYLILDEKPKPMMIAGAAIVLASLASSVIFSRRRVFGLVQ